MQYSYIMQKHAKRMNSASEIICSMVRFDGPIDLSVEIFIKLTAALCYDIWIWPHKRYTKTVHAMRFNTFECTISHSFNLKQCIFRLVSFGWEWHFDKIDNQTLIWNLIISINLEIKIEFKYHFKHFNQSKAQTFFYWHFFSHVFFFQIPNKT